MEGPLKPIVPFEPVRADAVPEGADWTHQIKWDGVRIVTYAEGGRVELYNRKLHRRTEHYPELLDVSSYAGTESIVLDGEVVALSSDGKPSFHEVMRRDGLRRMERVEEARRIVPIYYMVFDLLYLNGQWLLREPFHVRQELLARWLRPSSTVQPVAHHDDGQALLNVVRAQGMEGIVCKRQNSAYAPGGKDDRWVKVKNYRDLHVVVGGFTLNSGVVNAILTGLYDRAGRLIYIGHVGTGRLSKREWRELTERLQPLITAEKPFAGRTDREREAIWVRPLVTAKVMYSEWRWQEGRTLRQPSIQAFVDVPPEECRFPEE